LTNPAPHLESWVDHPDQISPERRFLAAIMDKNTIAAVRKAS
jgi:hypothetical protein